MCEILSLFWFKMSRPTSLQFWVQFLALGPFPLLCADVPVPLPECWVVCPPPHSWGPRESWTLSRALVQCQQIISSLACDMFPKVLIGKFQIVGIFMNCTLDQIHVPWGFLFPTLPPVSPLFELRADEVHLVIYLTSQSLLSSCSFSTHFVPTSLIWGHNLWVRELGHRACAGTDVGKFTSTGSFSFSRRGNRFSWTPSVSLFVCCITEAWVLVSL